MPGLSDRTACPEHRTRAPRAHAAQYRHARQADTDRQTQTQTQTYRHTNIQQRERERERESERERERGQRLTRCTSRRTRR
eukprot:3706253-Rhodomonas_salina.2